MISRTCGNASKKFRNSDTMLTSTGVRLITRIELFSVESPPRERWDVFQFSVRRSVQTDPLPGVVLN